MRRAFLPLGALLLLLWPHAATMEPQHQEGTGALVQVPGGEGLRTSFSCHGRVGGYYADIETGCQLYHLCDGAGRQFTHACPNLTLFQQRMMICDHWYMVNCSAAIVDYAANLLLGQRDQPFLRPEDNLHQQQHQQRRQRVPLPVAFPYNRQEDGYVETSEDPPATSTHKSKSRMFTGGGNTVKTSANKHKPPVNDGRTISFSISSLPSPESSGSVSNENSEYNNQRRFPDHSEYDYKSHRRVPQITEEPVPVNQRRNKYNRTTELPVTGPRREIFSISSLPTTKISENSGSVSNKGSAVPAYRTPPDLASLRETFSISSLPNTRTQEPSGHVGSQNSRLNLDYSRETEYPQVPVYQSSTPKLFSNTARTKLAFETQTDKPVYDERPYVSETNTPLPAEYPVNFPSEYRNNPFFQAYFQSSSAAPTSSATVILRTTPPVPPLLPAFNSGVEEDEDEDLGNRIEIILQDPRRMFFIPDSDLDLDSALYAQNSTVLVIPLPSPDHRHGAMRFRSDEKLIEGRNLDCPRCHPAFLLPGQCQPCVLIR